MPNPATDAADADLGHPLDKMFSPRSIALVGATEKSVWSRLIIQNYPVLGYAGKVFAVNRRGEDVLGVPGFPSCSAIGEPVDVAFFSVPQAAVIEALEEAASAGVRNAVILTSGYAEVGEEGAALQDALMARAKELGVTVWGPNSLGFNNVGDRIPVSAISAMQPILPPSIAIVTQSGATAIELNELAHSQNIGSSFVAATGNEAAITLADLVDYLIDHEPTRAIAIFAESVRDPAAFIRAAERARDTRKPIVMLKIGRSALSGAVAQAHTGSLVGDDRVFDAICERLAVIRVNSLEALITTAGLVAAIGPLSAPGLGFISVSGGACTMAADYAEAAGVALPPHSPAVIEDLRKVLPSFAATLNPLDITGVAMGDPPMFGKTIPIVASSPDIGLIGISLIVPTVEGQGFPPALPYIGEAVAALDKPAILVATTTRTLTDYTRSWLAQYRLPHIVTGINPMLDAVARLWWWSQRIGRRPPQPIVMQPAAAAAARPVGERAVLDRLAGEGVPVIPGRVARSAAEAAELAATFDGAAVLKISSADIAHKTEVGGVRLNVAPEAVADTFDAIMRDVAQAAPNTRLDGVIVSPMRQGGLELLVSVSRDPIWGPMIAVGFGGVLVELLDDAAITPLPAGRDEIIELLRRLRGAALLDGYRGGAAVDIDRLADAIVAIGDAALGFGAELDLLEINPLLVSAGRTEALDALIGWRKDPA
jgi:acyl-CoA synthetase (NDP forming)